MNQLFARKSADRLMADAQARGEQLRRVLGKWDLTALGIGALIGAGIFASTGSAIAGGADHVGAGPAIVLSFLMTATACGFAALCYAEFAAMVPISGSAYTYAYASLGELVAWIIGWDLIIEYAVGNIAVAISWAGHFRELLQHFGIGMPVWTTIDYRTAYQAAEAVAAGATDPGTVHLASAVSNAPQLFGLPLIVNIPAVAIVALITVILVYGIRESATTNSIMVLIKIGIVLFFIAVGAFFVKSENYTVHGGFAPNGFRGVASAAAIIFFAYIGFDAVSTAAEETKNPAKDMPFGIIMSLVVTTVLYIFVALVMTGMTPWNKLDTAEPMLTALELSGGSAKILSVGQFVIAFGAVFALASVLLVFQLGQPRIFFSMARDGLLPPFAAKVHPKYRTPHITTILTGVFVGVFAAFANIDEVVQLTNIGTLFAFAIVAGGVLILHYREPNRPRPFRTPWMPWTPLIAIGACVFLMFQLPLVTWLRFLAWLAIGLVIYIAYGYRHSRLRGGGAPSGGTVPGGTA
jgi:APA family basic amino acid/polyamine antiporter